MESIGTYLRRERELRKISLEELSYQTRVPVKYLEAIEAEQFEAIPGATFAKGYLKAYAQYIGLVPEEVLLRFEDMLENLTIPAHKTLEEPQHVYRIIGIVILFTLILFGILWAVKG